MKTLRKILLPAIATLVAFSAGAKENVKKEGERQAQQPAPLKVIAEACDPSQSRTDLAVNNVRATILGGGDMWWDLTSGQYEVPVGSNKHSLFAGSLWFGGLDDGNQLKVAAMTYRQTGNDFWPGPIDPVTVSTDKTVCDEFDKHFRITLSEVKELKAWMDDPAVSGYTPSSEVLNWPGNRTPNTPGMLAPFVDGDQDGIYAHNTNNNGDRASGDYPAYDLDNSIDCGSLDSEEDGILFGDETLFWVFNDKGDIHSESGAEAIGLEIHAQAFGFATNDEINDMTFYSYKIINRATTTLNQTYIGQWVDPDLGKYDDDYVGCDVGRGLGYCYNGDNNDEGATGYGNRPPAIGADFFQGPLADAGDGIDNDRDGTIDEAGEQIIMSKFVYYNNDFSLTGNPSTGTHFYNYLDGKWKDGQKIVYGGDGRTSGGVLCDFMFPGDTDPTGWGTGGVPQATWTEQTAGNQPADRRFLQSAGTFTLQPGAVNFVTIGMVWAQSNTVGNAFASVEDMRLADDLAQALFDNCFKVTDGPDAPDVEIIELDKKLVLTLGNRTNSNNYQEGYEEFDPLIVCPNPGVDPCDTLYYFEGYQIYQLKDQTVSSSQLNNPDQARLVAQVDIQNGVGQLVNYIDDKAIGALVPMEMVDGEDKGVRHSFVITEDKFATGDARLVNHKDYYFMAIAYGYNAFPPYDPTTPAGLDGQKKPYKAGRNNLKVYKGTPHISEPKNGGTVLNAEVGDYFPVTRISGSGNGGNAVYLNEESLETILNANCGGEITYTREGGPIRVQVIDPSSVKPNQYRVAFNGTGENATFELYDVTGGDTLIQPSPNVPIGTQYEHVYPDYGFTIAIDEVPSIGDSVSVRNFNNGFLEASQEPAVSSWLAFIPDVDAPGSAFNWIRSGTNTAGPGSSDKGDPNQVYETVLGGTWAPYSLVNSEVVASDGSTQGHGPAWTQFQSLNKIEATPSVDIVFTSDKSKWTRVPVIETQDESVNAEGQVQKMRLRAGQSVDKDGNPDGSGNGWGWFPGYAIDVDKGIRLNMMFGEDSWLEGDNGRDMIWNPSSRVTYGLGGIAFGGKHYVYVMNTRYQGADETANPHYAGFNNPTNVNLRNIYKEVNWVGIPFLTSSDATLLAEDVKVSIRVTNPYQVYNGCGLTGTDPEYMFDATELAAVTNSRQAANSALDAIGVVPNPYYAYSDYETSQLENKVKIINLPASCVVSIYTVNGALVRRFDKESANTFLEWDLKNSAGIPVASGVYMFHIDAGDAGEKVVKWFGATRPIDLDTF